MKKPYKGHIKSWGLKHLNGELVLLRVLMTSDVECLVRTSPIRVLTPNMVETRNSIYSLGEMAAS